MGNKEYLNVNELATLFGLKVQTLHYYDKIGILKPSYRDPNNGYRQYRFDQTYKLASIRYMRKLGYSIEAVRDFQDTKDPDEALQRLKERSAAIHEQWEEMMRIDHAILRKIQFIEDSKDEIDYEELEEKVENAENERINKMLSKHGCTVIAQSDQHTDFLIKSGEN